MSLISVQGNLFLGSYQDRKTDSKYHQRMVAEALSKVKNFNVRIARADAPKRSGTHGLNAGSGCGQCGMHSRVGDYSQNEMIGGGFSFDETESHARSVMTKYVSHLYFLVKRTGVARLPRLAGLMLLVCVPVSSVAAQSGGERPRTQRASPISSEDAAALSRALAAYDEGRSAAVRPELERLALKYPDNFAANEALGLLYVDAGDFGRALPFLERGARAKKTDAVAQANLGAAYLQTGNAAAAVKTLRKAASLDEKNAQTLSNLGHALFQNKQPLEAANVFAKAAALAPGDLDISYNWVVALHEAGKDTQAAEVLQRVPESKRNAAFEALWGDIAERQGHYLDAADHMQNAARLDPSEANIYDLAVELLRHWSWEPATKIAKFGVERFPASRRLQMAEGIAYYGNGRYTEAAAIFGTLLAADPENETYGSLLGRSCSSMGGNAAPQCDSLVGFAEKHPANAQIAIYAALSILHGPATGPHLDQAQQLLEQAIRVDSKLPEAYYQLGVLQQQRLQWNESERSLTKAIELRPSFAEAHYRLARAYSHTGRHELATKEIALQQQYSQQEKAASDARLKEVTTFLVTSH
jgi:tetratricopeptide (TPR) repeat protein